MMETLRPTDYHGVYSHESSSYGVFETKEPTETAKGPNIAGGIKTKSKIGCITCMAYHITCDESKPSCFRCLNSGRFCDGYAPLEILPNTEETGTRSTKENTPTSPPYSGLSTPEVKKDWKERLLPLVPDDVSYIQLFRGTVASSGSESQSWAVYVSLLPTASQPFPFEKGTVAYKRCFSRGLHKMVVIPDKGSSSFNDAINEAFSEQLCGRRWEPLIARLCDAKNLYGLPMLRRLPKWLVNSDYDANFLQRNCAVNDEGGKILDLYIALSEYTISWAELRDNTPYKDGLEGFWNHDPLLDGSFSERASACAELKDVEPKSPRVEASCTYDAISKNPNHSCDVEKNINRRTRRDKGFILEIGRKSLRRASRPLVKSGCATCKVRRVKCDDEFPICEKCNRSGRICQRYDHEPDIINSHAPRPPQPNRKALGDRYESGASLPGSIQALSFAMGERSDLSMKPSMRSQQPSESGGKSPKGPKAPSTFEGWQLPGFNTPSSQLPWLQLEEGRGETQPQVSGRENQMVEDMEALRDYETGAHSAVVTISSSQSDAEYANLEDETDWDEDDKSTNIEQIEEPGRDDPFGRMARKVGEIMLRPIIMQTKQDLVDQLMGQFWELNTQGRNTHTRARGGSVTSAPSHSPDAEGHSIQSSRDKSGARVREKPDDGDPEDEEQDSKRPRLGTSPSSVLHEITLFACPYRKHDPRKYNVNNWSICALTPHRTVARVKGHLYRYHRIHLCPRCKVFFDSEGELEEHVLAPAGCDLRSSGPIEGITSKMKEQLQCRKKTHPGQTEAERWEQIYQIIFPNVIVPSPYFEPVRDHEEIAPQSPGSHELTRYEEYLRRELPRYFRGVIETAVNGEVQPIEARLRREIMSLLDEARNHALSNYRATSDSSSMLITQGSRVKQPQVEIGSSPCQNFETHPTEILETFYQPPPPSAQPELTWDVSNCLHNVSQDRNDLSDIQNDSDFHFHMSRPDSSENLTLDRTSSNTTDNSSFQNISDAIDPTSLEDLELHGGFDFLDDLDPNYQKGIDLDPFTVGMPWDTSSFMPLVPNEPPIDSGD